TSPTRNIWGGLSQSRPRSFYARARPPAISLRFPWRYTAPSGVGTLGLGLFLRRAQTHLPRAREDGVLEIGGGVLVHVGVDPAAGLVVALLAEHAGLHAVGAQFAAEDEDVDLEALVGRGGRAVPIGDDDAAKGIGRGQGHEGNRVERGVPEEGIDADARSAAAVVAGGVVVAEYHGDDRGVLAVHVSVVFVGIHVFRIGVIGVLGAPLRVGIGAGGVTIASEQPAAGQQQPGGQAQKRNSRGHDQRLLE